MKKMKPSVINQNSKINHQIYPFTQLTIQEDSYLTKNIVQCNLPLIFTYNIENNIFRYHSIELDVEKVKFAKKFIHIVINVFVHDNMAIILYFQGSLGILNLTTFEFLSERTIFHPIFQLKSSSLIQIVNKKEILLLDQFDKYKHVLFSFNRNDIFTDGINTFIRQKDNIMQINCHQIQYYHSCLLGLTTTNQQIINKNNQLLIDSKIVDSGIFTEVWIDYIMKQTDSGLQLYLINDFQLQYIDLGQDIVNIQICTEGILVERQESLYWFDEYILQ